MHWNADSGPHFAKLFFGMAGLRCVFLNKTVMFLSLLTRYPNQSTRSISELEVFAMREYVLALCVFFCAAAPVGLLAQSDATATVAGTVLDVAGKPISYAAVSVRNQSTGSARPATTDADGHF